MRLEYFQLIDRIVDLDVGERTITVAAQVPTHNTIFEGHFPGYPLMPGVLLLEAMAQTSGWLLIALLKFERMPFLAAVKEAKMRGFVTPGELLEHRRQHRSRRFGLCPHLGDDPGRRRIAVQRDDHVPARSVPEPGFAPTHGSHGRAHRLSAAGHRP